MPRASMYNQEMVDNICASLAKGQSLRSICRADDMPHIETVRVWLRDKEGFAAQYARAREEQADHYADEIIEIADKTDDPQKAKVQIDSRKWIASKLKPKKYGDRQTVEHDTTESFNDFLAKLKNG